MSSLRLEIEQILGLRFPERNKEALVKFEETMEIPKSAETLMKGPYKDPEEVRRGISSLHQETTNILDILLPRRARLREWSEQLPEYPKEAEKFIRETSEQLSKQEKRRQQVEWEILEKIQASNLQELFPIPLSAFGAGSFLDKSVKIYLRPINRLAEILQLNPELLRQSIRIHFIFFLLIITGLDLDNQTYTRGNEEITTQMLAAFFTQRFLRVQPEHLNSYNEWIKSISPKNLNSLGSEHSTEKIRTAAIFWRRSQAISWDECLNLANQLDKHENNNYRFSEELKYPERKDFYN